MMKNRFPWTPLLILIAVALTLGGRLAADEPAAPRQTVALAPSQMSWSAPTVAGNDTTVLWGDRAHGQHATLSHYPPGYGIEPHFHTNDMRGLIVSGTWVLGIVDGPSYELPAGSYFFLPGKTAHTDLCKGPEPCMMFLMQEDARDLVPLKPSVNR